MLNGIIKGDLKLNKNVNKYLDICLKCNACKNFCPSGVDARKIFTAAKAEYFESLENARSSKFIKILNSAPVFNLFLNSMKITTSTYRFLKIDKFMEKIYPILLKMDEFGKKIILANEFLSRGEEAKRRRGVENDYASTHPRIHSSIIYFKGCVNENFNPRSKKAVENILNQAGIKILPVNFQCCGVPFLSCGNVEQFRKQAEFNLSQIPEDFDYFITDCASCQNAFKEYEYYVEDEKLLEKLKKINEKSINIVDFIVKNVKSFEFKEKTTFTFHKPCHLENFGFLQEFLSKSKNVEYIEMKDFDKCCGFSGQFAIKNPEISKQISKEKAKNAIETNANYILTSCPACILGLTQGIIEAKKNQNYASMHLCILASFIEFISTAKIEI